MERFWAGPRTRTLWSNYSFRVFPLAIAVEWELGGLPGAGYSCDGRCENIYEMLYSPAAADPGLDLGTGKKALIRGTVGGSWIKPVVQLPVLQL